MSDGNSHFLMALGRHDGGHVIDTADEALKDVIAAVMRTGKKGSVSITMSVGANGETGLEVSCKVKATAPEVEFGKSFYFMGKQGELTRNAPQYVQDTLLKSEQ